MCATVHHLARVRLLGTRIDNCIDEAIRISAPRPANVTIARLYERFSQECLEDPCALDDFEISLRRAEAILDSPSLELLRCRPSNSQLSLVRKRYVALTQMALPDGDKARICPFTLQSLLVRAQRWLDFAKKLFGAQCYPTEIAFCLDQARALLDQLPLGWGPFPEAQPKRDGARIQ